MKRIKVTPRKVIEFAFVVTFFLIWLPRAVPYQSIITFLWPIYHWYGVDYYFRLVRAPGILVGSIIAWLSVIFIREYISNSKAIARIPVRIHVTGIRGKTTTTRLIGAALRYRGLRVITKTTGKAARLIDENGTEHRIREHHEEPNLREQPRIIGNVAVSGDVDAIVFECMSIRPKNIIAESRFVRSTISVITNVRADHLDVMGPTLEDVAWALSGIVPRNGLVVTAEKKYLPIIRKRAEERTARVVEVDADSIPDGFLTKFSYMIFKENIAVALKVCTLLGVPSEDALNGMLEARPDPGLTRILNATIGNQSVRFIAAFGVNDVDSTRIVFEELKRRGFIEGRRLVGLFHARDDRVTRTLEFAQVMARMPFEEILVVGKMTSLFVSQATKEGYGRENIFDLGTVDPSKIIHFLETMSGREDNRGIALFGCGNMIGIESFIQEFENLPERQPTQVVGAEQ